MWVLDQYYRYLSNVKAANFDLNAAWSRNCFVIFITFNDVLNAHGLFLGLENILS